MDKWHWPVMRPTNIIPYQNEIHTEYTIIYKLGKNHQNEIHTEYMIIHKLDRNHNLLPGIPGWIDAASDAHPCAST